MSDWEAGDQLAARPQGVSCGMLALMGLASLLLAIVALGLLWSILFPSTYGPGQVELPPHPAIGQTPGAVELEPLLGADQPVTLENLRGKVVLVNFWATWCGPCQLEAPHLARLGKELRDRPDFVLLSVSCGETLPEDVDLLRGETSRFLDSLELDLPVYVDTRWTTRDAFDALGRAPAIPKTFLLDRQGVVRGLWLGFDEQVPGQIEQLTLELLQEATRQGEAGPPR